MSKPIKVVVVVVVIVTVVFVKKNYVQKIFDPKTIHVQKILGPKVLDPKNNLGQEKGPKKFWSRKLRLKKFRSKIFGVQINFGSNKFTLKVWSKLSR